MAKVASEHNDKERDGTSEVTESNLMLYPRSLRARTQTQVLKSSLALRASSNSEDTGLGRSHRTENFPDGAQGKGDPRPINWELGH